ncbi:MAG: family transporter substrate-binding protein, partial [Marmoricola sp.]|nr:family transporter substrate-binding protein [Marmoricola sp.]
MRRSGKIATAVLVGALALAGCGSSSKSSGGSGSSASNDVCKTAKGSGPKVGVAYDVGGRGDQSFNDSAYQGLEKAVKDLKATCIEAKATTDDNDTVRAERLRTLAEGGYNPV